MTMNWEIRKMPIAGKGMRLTSMDRVPAAERGFNLWYDGEQLAERVAIEGFLEARRYVAHAASPKYLCLYSTETFAVLDSPAYRTVLANPTPWSKTTMARFKNMIRAVAHITISRGQGRGAALGIIRLRPTAESKDTLRAMLTDQLDPAGLDGIISMHLIESDSTLSRPIGDVSSTANPGAGDWYVLIDGTYVSTVSAVVAARFTDAAGFSPATVISTGTYNLMWDLAKSDIPIRPGN